MHMYMRWLYCARTNRQATLWQREVHTHTCARKTRNLRPRKRKLSQAMGFPWQSVTPVAGQLIDSKVWVLKVSKFQSFKFQSFKSFKVSSRVESFKVSKFQSSKVSKFQSFKVSKAHGGDGGRRRETRETRETKGGKGNGGRPEL